jgi:hypothetical protein
MLDRRELVSDNVNLRPTVSRSVGQSVLVSSTQLGLMNRFLILSNSCGVVDVRRSLWRENGSAVYNCCWSSPAQSFFGPSTTGLVAIFYCLRYVYYIATAVLVYFEVFAYQEVCTSQYTRIFLFSLMHATYPAKLFRDFIIPVFATELESGDPYIRSSLSGPYILPRTLSSSTLSVCCSRKAKFRWYMEPHNRGYSGTVELGNKYKHTEAYRPFAKQWLGK